MRLFIECPECKTYGSIIVDMSCGCCQTTEECPRCDGEGYVFYKDEPEPE